MPDLITHISTTYLLAQFMRKRVYLPVALLGAILPDVLTRSFYFLFYPALWITTVFHTPVGALLVSLLITEFFPKELKKQVFISLIVGFFFHFILDFFQIHMYYGYQWLFPFGMASVEIKLFWPDEILFLMFASMFISIAYLYYRGMCITK